HAPRDTPAHTQHPSRGRDAAAVLDLRHADLPALHGEHAGGAEVPGVRAAERPLAGSAASRADQPAPLLARSLGAAIATGAAGGLVLAVTGLRAGLLMAALLGLVVGSAARAAVGRR